jgi:outer membrane biosynthesis protein TonB
MNKIHEFAFCPECGHKLDGTENKCPKCNFVFVQEPPVEKQSEASVHNENTVPPPPPVEKKEEVAPPITEDKKEEAVPSPPPIEKEAAAAPPPPPAEKKEEPKVEEAKKEEEPKKEEPKQSAPQSAVPPQSPPPAAKPPQSTSAPLPPKKKSGAGKWILIILLIIVVLVAAFAGLIKFGVIPTKTVSFIPNTIMQYLDPSSNTTVAEPKVEKQYFVCYTMAYVKKEKMAVVSNVITTDADATDLGVQNKFKEMLGVRFPKDFYKFSTVICKKFSNMDKAIDERERVKKDYQKDNCKIELLDVVYN